MLKFARTLIQDRRRTRVKAFWRNKRNPCDNGRRIFEALTPTQRQSITRMLEFGASWGGNLQYLLGQLPQAHAVGIDINPIVTELAGQEPRYQGIVGDEGTLGRYGAREFDLAFTISVLDHIPVARVVEQVLDELLRVARNVILLEPWIDGVHGDVSGKTRDQVKRGLMNGYKPFAEFCYIWNYDAMLERRAVRWTKTPLPLHAASLGPFYHLYTIASSTGSS